MVVRPVEGLAGVNLQPCRLPPPFLVLFFGGVERDSLVPHRPVLADLYTTTHQPEVVCRELRDQHGEFKVRNPLRKRASSLLSDIHRFEYVKHFEQPDNLIPNTWIVVRIDGRGFTKYGILPGHSSLAALCNHPGRFATRYAWEKPNDRRAIDLMNAAAKAVMNELPDIFIGYGISDEYRYQSCMPFSYTARQT